MKLALDYADQAEDPEALLYNPLLKVALRQSYVGVLNSYLQDEIAALACADVVDEDAEALATCQCCGYRSLRERGIYDICRVCFWEDDGTTDADSVSSPNHMTLREARLNIQRFGAVTEKARAHVLSDGKKRFPLAGA